MAAFTRDEWMVLKHISDEDVSPLGAVDGDAFRHLLALGAVEVHGEGVCLSEYGWEVMVDARGDRGDDEDVSASWT